MSRIGKKTITLPDYISASLEKNKIIITGPKGKLSYLIPAKIKVEINKVNDIKTINITTTEIIKKSKELHGLSRTLINNMITGVSKGFHKELEIQGVGYRCQMDQEKLILNIGYSHNITINPPQGISIAVHTNNIIISGINKELVGQVAATIRAARQPEPYKGKGIKYKSEIIRKKVGKAGK